MIESAKVVIVAEDETPIRSLAVEILSDAGFEVIEASHAEEALSALRSYTGTIHVLFTDIQMPGAMNGLALAHHVRSHWPWVALLITTGGEKPQAAELPEASRFLGKPYHSDCMLTHIRELAATA